MIFSCRSRSLQSSSFSSAGGGAWCHRKYLGHGQRVVGLSRVRRSASMDYITLVWSGSWWSNHLRRVFCGRGRDPSKPFKLLLGHELRTPPRQGKAIVWPESQGSRVHSSTMALKQVRPCRPAESASCARTSSCSATGKSGGTFWLNGERWDRPGETFCSINDHFQAN